MSDTTIAAQKAGGIGWGWVLTAGIASVVLGLFMLVYPGWASVAVTLFIGWAFIIAGVFEFFSGIANRKGGGMWTHIFLGLLTAVCGVLLAFNLLAGTLTLTMVFVLWLLVDGTITTVMAIAQRGTAWGWKLASGLISLLLGILLITSMPLAAVWIIGVYAGIVLLFRGMTLTFVSFEVRRLNKA